jgi:hypothetical protein
MSSGYSSNRNKIFVVLLTLAALALLAGNAYARNPDLQSNWAVNLSGDEPAGEVWNDGIQEIEAVGATVHVTYWANLGNSRARLYYRRSTDGGQTWQPKILLYDTDPDGSYFSGSRGWKFLAVDGTSVHVAYAVYPMTGHYGNRLMYHRSTDNGASFEAVRQLAPTSGVESTMFYTRIAASGGGVAIAMSYQENGVEGALPYVATLNSADGGSTFTFNYVATSEHNNWGITVGDLKRVGNRIYLLYARDLQEPPYYGGDFSTALYCATSLDGGANFTHTQMTTQAASGKYLTYDIQGADYSPNVAVDGNQVYVVWTQNDTSFDSNDQSLYIRRSADQGQHFAAPQKLAQNQTDGIANIELGQETVAAQGGHVYVAFMTTDGAVYLRRSADNGAGFFPLQNMGSDARWPNMAVDPAEGAKVHVFWHEFYRYSADGGATFTRPVTFMPFNGSTDGGTQMALGPGDSKHFVVSLSYSYPPPAGDKDIFYRRLDPVPAPSGRDQALKTFSETTTTIQRHDCMEVASSDYLNFAAQMSAEVWVKPQAGGGSASTNARLIIHKLTSSLYPRVGDQRTYSLGTYPVAGGVRQALAELLTTAGPYSLSAASGNPIGLVSDNTWTHLAMTYDASAAGNNFKLYKNGQVIAETQATGNVATGNGNFFAGYYGRWEMDEVRLWDRALSQSEINANMRRKLTGSEAGLNAYYQFNGTTKDMTLHGNDGILLYKESYVPSTLTLNAGGLPAVYSLLLSD